MKFPTIQIDKAFTRHVQKNAFWMLVILIVSLAGLYGYLLSKSVVNVIVREEVEEQISHTNARISELELSYIKAKNSVTMELARDMGFEKVEGKRYVTRGPAEERLTLRSVTQ